MFITSLQHTPLCPLISGLNADSKISAQNVYIISIIERILQNALFFHISILLLQGVCTIPKKKVSDPNQCLQEYFCLQGYRLCLLLDHTFYFNVTVKVSLIALNEHKIDSTFWQIATLQ